MSLLVINSNHKYKNTLCTQNKLFTTNMMMTLTTIAKI